MEEQIPKKIREIEGYTSYWQPAEKKGYSGTGTYFKHGLEPKSVGTLGVEEFDMEGRVQLFDMGKFMLLNAYFPNSQPERKRLDYKLRFVDAMIEQLQSLVKAKKNILLVGDYNIAHTEIDLARPKDNENSAGYYIEEREAMTKFLEAGFIDTFRHFNKEPNNYTWWSYRGGARARNVGWRIDVAAVNKSFIKKVKSAGTMPDVMGSDHCPIFVELAL